MFLIRPNVLSKICLKNPGLIYSTRKCHWLKDYKPGPYPKTPEEREAAAKKYGLLPEDYKPFPDDGFHGLGDYPDLPVISAESRDDFYPYDIPSMKRNFNEPLFANEDAIGEHRYDVNKRHRVPIYIQFFQFVGVIGAFYATYYFLGKITFFLPVAEKQYPKQGATHYSFETC